MLTPILQTTPDAIRIYWLLLRITVPITIAAEALSRFGVIEMISPALAPVMEVIGLPPALGFAFLMANRVPDRVFYLVCFRVDNLKAKVHPHVR